MKRMTRTTMALILLALVIFESCKQQKVIALPQERPNILLLFLDDMDPDFGCYGNTLTTTPNIDQLAKEGVLFTRAYATAPVCSPSHTSILTGCYSTSIGASNHRSSYIDKLPEGYTILTELMSRANYFTVNFKSNGDRMFNKIYGASAKTDLNFDRGEPENNGESGKEVFDYLQIIDPMNIATYFKGGEWDKKGAGQPFFAYANIETAKKHGFEPGRIWAKERGIAVDSTRVEIPQHYADTDEVRHVLASSLDAVSHADFEVGKFLNALEKSGYAKNTLVILLSDHGATLQRHKQCLWQSGIHVPLILRWPGHIEDSWTNTELASIIDIAPTILSAAKIPVPQTMEGLNLLGDALETRNYVFATRDGMNNFFDASRTVITKDYQYIHHFFPELPFRSNPYAKRTLTFESMLELYKGDKLDTLQALYFEPEKVPYELYDLKKDGEETKNIAFNPEYQEEVKKMQEILFEWQKRTGDSILDARKLLNVPTVPINTQVDDLLKLNSK
ncbi:DUF229 domain-containing protein [Zobellia amurskyensis]|uniref:DUF229 domain-containing protein n=1 Tax=Zobellia amurskyensis TaxID=248905 RepID=A0A7X2ZSE8_9FLAO|nr:sulfatase [Zobellia amurskyensis]MUH35522.1 DUF229 domain-containing protein [Zobellia amurskyensis]